MTNNQLRITSIAGLVNALSVEAICANLHVDRQEVACWVAANHIPNGWHLRLHLGAQLLQLDVDTAAVFEVAAWKMNIEDVLHFVGEVQMGTLNTPHIPADQYPPATAAAVSIGDVAIKPS